jgi:hypothetical protein
VPQLYNQTSLVEDIIPMIDKDGRNVGVVIAKGTYELGANGLLKLAKNQDKILYEDEFTGPSGHSDIRVPSDLVDYKPGTDIVIVPPEKLPAKNSLLGWKVSIEVGPVRKVTRVRKKWTLGPLRRDEKTRIRFAGTYDDDWIENRMPLLPNNFDPRYNQVSPSDQVVPGYLRGDEYVKLINLFGGGVVEFILPGRALVVSANVMNHYFTKVAVLDTVIIWSDKPRIILVWRHAIVCRQKIEEIRNVFICLVRLRTVQELFT